MCKNLKHFFEQTCRIAGCRWSQWTAEGALLYCWRLEFPPCFTKERNMNPVCIGIQGTLKGYVLRVIVVQSVSACGATLYWFHGSGIKGSLPRRLLLLTTFWLGHSLFLCYAFVVDAKQQTVVHDLKTLKNLTGDNLLYSKVICNNIKQS